MKKKKKKQISKLHVSLDPKYTFGFTGFKAMGAVEEEPPDEFLEWAKDVRKKSGIIDPEPEKAQKAQVVSWPIDKGIVGQILYKGQVTINSPRYHGQIYGITGVSDEEEKE
jgi:hypothetical protein